VAETLDTSPGISSNSRRTTVVLPAPERPLTTITLPAELLIALSDVAASPLSASNLLAAAHRELLTHSPFWILSRVR